jgi:hypothetical protein
MLAENDTLQEELAAASGWSRAALFFTDDDWEEVRRWCKAVDIDADTVMVRIRGLAGLGKFELRQALALIAQSADTTVRLQRRELSPSDLAKGQSDIIEDCRTLRTRLDDFKNYNRIDPATHVLQFPPRLFKLAWRAKAALEELSAELEPCRGELAAMGSDQGKGNSTAHNQFWKELAHVFYAHANKDKLTAKHLAHLLVACSMPFFPEETTYGAALSEAERTLASLRAASRKAASRK